MIRRTAVAFLAVALVAPALAADKSPLEGNWEITALTRDGKADATLNGAIRAHTGEKYSVTPPPGSSVPKAEGTAAIDGDRKTIDMKPNSGRYKDKTLKGIYKLDGDTLTIAFSSDPDKDRPTAFESKEGSGVVLAVHKRTK